MAGQHHALMKDADDGNTVFALTVDVQTANDEYFHLK